MEKLNIFEEAYELDITAYLSSDLTNQEILDLEPYNFNTLLGHKKGINYLFKIFWLFKEEMDYIVNIQGEDNVFDKTLSILASGFLTEFKKKNDWAVVLTQYIEELNGYKFVTLEKDSDWKGKEITINRISRMIYKLRQRRIEFYESILQEYKVRKDQYNERLERQLRNDNTKFYTELKESDIFESFPKQTFLNNIILVSKDLFAMETYELDILAYYKRSLKGIKDKKTNVNLKTYRSNTLWGYKEGVDFFLDIFSIFKEEMSYILTENLDKNFIERTLTVLIRDFIDEFEKKGDLENVLVEYIENLEKYEFLSLQKEVFFDKISKMIYSLRARRIEFYEAVLDDYLANKEKYDNAM